jgi:hypothetical protein
MDYPAIEAFILRIDNLEIKSINFSGKCFVTKSDVT